jgi:threonine dehydratase
VLDPSDLPTVADIRAAAQRLAGQAVRTPLLNVPSLDRRLGFRLLVKAEPLQRTGSFKFRGAYNRLSLLSTEERRAGVVAFSSGNHAQGVAAAAALLGIEAVIVMPSDAPAIKIARTREFGAEVVTYDRQREDREAVAGEIARSRRAVTVRPFDDRGVIAGQGTIGLELAEQAAAMGAALDAVVVPTSGGGLVAGCALALEAESPSTRVYSAEPAGYDDYARSLAAGHRLANEGAPGSICDALLVQRPGEITFAVNRERLAGGVVATDEEVRRAMALAFDCFRLVVEPGGAVALAAALAGRIPGAPQTIAVVASGGNVDRYRFVEALEA